MKTIMAAAVLAATMAGSTVAAKADTTVGFPPASGAVFTEPKGKFTQDVSVIIGTSGATLVGIAAGASTPGLTFSLVELFKGATSLFKATVSGPSFSVFPDPAVVLQKGTYTLAISGVVSRATGSFNGNYTLSTVPLPTSVALFGTAILGLGAFGAIRRKGKAAAGAAA